MKKSQLAEVLEERFYHVTEAPTLMCVFKHGNFVCAIPRDELNGKYSKHQGIPHSIQKLVETYGDM